LSATDLLAQPFGTLAELITAYAAAHPNKPALIDATGGLSYVELDTLIDRIAASLQRDGVTATDVVAICATTSINYAATFLATLRAGATVAPLAPSSTPDSLALMLADSGAKLLFLDASTSALFNTTSGHITLDDSPAGIAFSTWLAPLGATPTHVTILPEYGFNLIYSSGTTGMPKGILQAHEMRWSQLSRLATAPDTITMISTPLYSNTTLVSFLPTLAAGATVVMMAKFDATHFLQLAEKHRVTHAMLVPVQYRRLLEHPNFDSYDLSSFVMKFATSAPFPAALKAQVLARWPGGLIEFYGMTEGGGSCMLLAHEHPDKLHTVGQPIPGHDIRLIDESGIEVPQGALGEIVGRSNAMMAGYHNQPGKTAEAEWYSPDGNRYIRTGDVGRFDAEGFLTLLDRKKDMIISGGFNIYPTDLEAELSRHDAVLESAVVGVPSDQWGETPVAFAVLKPGQSVSVDALKSWVNARLGKTQRLADLRLIDALPRSHIGKILKRDLRDSYHPAG
jgi:acyl-CoA synthetase (AMP-forming)/AMP-acid ligase II